MKTGAEILIGETEESQLTTAMLRDILFEHAAEARRDISAFFNFVMEHETTKEPLTVAPHQRVFFDFVMAHDRSVVMMPIGHSKTYSSAALTLFLLGQDPTVRGAVISATQGQASKIVSMVRDYIESSAKLKLVFPELRQSSRQGDAWTQTELVVERPPGIRDASLAAYGIGGDLPGSRLSWIIVDDILNDENTNTVEQRTSVCRFFDSTVTSRLDRKNARVVVTNTAWHPEDLPHALEKRGWPTLKMNVMGDITIQDDLDNLRNFMEPWDDKGLLRPATMSSGDPTCRLTEHDPDPNNQKLLWCEVVTEEWLEKERRKVVPKVFNQQYMNLCRDDGSAYCQIAWIESCKKKAREMGHHLMVSEVHSANPMIFTGVDLAISMREGADSTALFTFELLPGGYRKILDIDIGKYNGPTVRDKIIEIHRRYNSVIRVENVAAQDLLLQMVREKRVDVPIRPHTTNAFSKSNPTAGVQGVFVELFNGAWLIPNDKFGVCHPHVQKWIDECLYYEPSKHTGDALMACFFAREQAREWGVLSDTSTMGIEQGAIGMNLLQR